MMLKTVSNGIESTDPLIFRQKKLPVEARYVLYFPYFGVTDRLIFNNVNQNDIDDWRTWPDNILDKILFHELTHIYLGEHGTRLQDTGTIEALGYKDFSDWLLYHGQKQIIKSKLECK